MKIGKAWELRDYFTKAASDVARQLSFSGIAVIWLFKTTAGDVSKLPTDLLLPLFFFVLTLGLDFLHYLSASVEWSIFAWWQGRARGASEADDQIADAPAWLNRPHAMAFYLKLISLCAGYIFLLIRLWKQLS